MKLFPVLALVAAAAPLHAASRDAFGTTIQWSLSLDASGRIVALAPLDPNFLPDVRQQIEPVVRTWHFTPGLVAGKPQATETTLRVGVAFDSKNGKLFNGRIRNASTGPKFAHVVAPKYPDRALQARHDGAVVVLVEYDTQGHVISTANMTKMSTATDAQLVDAALDVVRQWTFNPEVVAGIGVPGKAYVPVCFTYRNEECRWNTPPGAKALQKDQPSAVASVVGIDMGAETPKAP